MYIIYKRIAKNIAPYIAPYMTPNQVTITRLLLFPPAAAYFFSMSHNHLNLLIGAILYWMFGLFDYVDGEVARIRSMASPLGEQLDTDVDKIGLRIVLLGITLGAYNQVHSVFVWVVAFFVLLGISMKDFIFLRTGSEQETSLKIPSRLVLNLFTLPEYLLIYGALLNRMYLSLMITAVVVNIRWVAHFMQYYLKKIG